MDDAHGNEGKFPGILISQDARFPFALTPRLVR
jgi:hypothetical protein